MALNIYQIENQKLHICKVCGTYFKSEEDNPNCCIFCEEDLVHLEVKNERDKMDQTSN